MTLPQPKDSTPETNIKHSDGEFPNTPFADALDEVEASTTEAGNDTAEVTRSEISELKPDAKVLAFPEKPSTEESEQEGAEDAEDPIDQLVAHIEGLSDLKEAYDLRSDLLRKRLIGQEKDGKNKRMVAIRGVEGSDRIVAALKKTFKRLNAERGKEAAKTRNLLADIAKQKTSPQISALAQKAHLKSYCKKAYNDEGKRDWVVTVIGGKKDSAKVVKAIMARKAEIETAEDEEKDRKKDEEEKKSAARNRSALGDILKKHVK